MDPGIDYSQPHPAVSFTRKAMDYLWRATWWKCPVCGTKPMFPALSQTRRLSDWLTPLDGCPHCGYAYDREPGYFLWSVWALGYIVSAAVGIGMYVFLQIWHSDWSFTATLVAVVLPLPFINVIFARHAKSYFLAVDHLADPYVRPDPDDDNGDGGGGPPLRPPASPADAPMGHDSAGPQADEPATAPPAGALK